MNILQFLNHNGSDKIKVVRYHSVYKHTQSVGWIEHDKDDWSSWYFYSDEAILLDAVEMKAIVAKIEGL